MVFEGTVDQIVALVCAYMAAKAQFPRVPKNGKANVGSFNYKYATLDKIIEKIDPILQKHDLAVVHPITRKDGKQMVSSILLHKNGGMMISDGYTIPENIKIQEQGSYTTYGRRYGFCALLGIVTEDDNERIVAAVGNKPLAVKAKAAASVGSAADPELPTKQELSKIVAGLNEYRAHVDDKVLHGYILRETGAAEARLIPKAEWKKVLAKLEATLISGGPEGLKELIEAE